MTLIVATEEKEEAEPVGEVLACLMREHPSRAVVLRITPERQACSIRVSSLNAGCRTVVANRFAASRSKSRFRLI